MIDFFTVLRVRIAIGVSSCLNIQQFFRMSVCVFLFASILFGHVGDANAQSLNRCTTYPMGPVNPGDDPDDPNTQMHTFPPGTINVFTGEDLSNQVVDFRYPYTGLVHRFVRCVQSIFHNVSETQLESLNDELQNFVKAMTTLYLIFFAIKIVFSGVRRLTGDIMVFVFTLTGVWAMTDYAALSFFLDGFIAVQETFVESISQSVDYDGRCVGTEEEGISVETPYSFNVWQRLDCSIARVFGAIPAEIGILDWTTGLIHVDPFGYDDPSGQRQSDTFYLLFWLVGQLILTSVIFGSLLLVLVFGLLILVVYLVMHAILVYLSAYVALVFLGLIAPVIIPMVLFSATQSIFRTWVTYLFAYTLQPAILFAYIVFMMNILNLMIDPSNSDTDTAIYNLSRGIAGGGLDPIYQRVKNDIDIGSPNLSSSTVIGDLSSSSTDLGDNISTSCDATSGNSSQTCTGVFIRGYVFSDDNSVHDELVVGYFLYNLIILIILFITAIFMKNVLEFGEVMVGLGVHPAVRIRTIQNAILKARNTLASRARG